jgi:hypothetical protein
VSSNPAVVGPFASQCDIVMFVVENLCSGKTPAAKTISCRFPPPFSDLPGRTLDNVAYRAWVHASFCADRHSRIEYALPTKGELCKASRACAGLGR